MSFIAVKFFDSSVIPRLGSLFTLTVGNIFVVLDFPSAVLSNEGFAKRFPNFGLNLIPLVETKLVRGKWDMSFTPFKYFSPRFC